MLINLAYVLQLFIPINQNLYSTTKWNYSKIIYSLTRTCETLQQALGLKCWAQDPELCYSIKLL